MDDNELIAQAASLTPVYVDGFGAFRKMNGVFRTVGFVMDGGATLNLIISLAGADRANFEARRCLDDKPTKTLSIWTDHSASH